MYVLSTYRISHTWYTLSGRSTVLCCTSRNPSFFLNPILYGVTVLLKSFLNPDRFVFLFCLFSSMKPQSDRNPRGITSIHHCSDASDMAADTVRSWHRTLYATYSTIGRIHHYAVCYDTVTDLLTSEVFLANHKGKVSVPGCCAFHTVNDAEKICQA